MKNKGLLVISLASIILLSCKSKHKVVTSKSHTKNRTENKYTTKKSTPFITTPSDEVKETESSFVTSNQMDKVIHKALSFKGTRYKYGGTTKSGMDCSGLMFASFKSANVVLPRTSLAQATKGNRVARTKIQKGDLVFFKTNGGRRINHVGLVVSKDSRNVKFVHASSSRGVMISSLREGYWSSAFVQARRLDLGTPSEEFEATSSTSKTKTYTVKSGDTLYAIARKYPGVSVSAIMSYNKLSSTDLKPGMLLLIP